MPSKRTLLTIGQSNHPLDHFLALLVRHGVEALVDIRRFPGSRKHPHFNRDDLASALQEAGIDYHWLEALGGRRNKLRDESPNLGLHNAGFRNYADQRPAQRRGTESRRQALGSKSAQPPLGHCQRRQADGLSVPMEVDARSHG
jgi:uncharacterized protein (DUF488 family)